MPANLLECQGGNSEDGTLVKTHSVLNKSLHFTNLDPNYANLTNKHETIGNNRQSKTLYVAEKTVCLATGDYLQ